MEPSKRSKMIKLTLFLFAFFLWPAFSYSAILGDLRLSLIEGDVQVKTADTEDWVPAAINTPVMAGDILWVPEGGKAERWRDGEAPSLWTPGERNGAAPEREPAERGMDAPREMKPGERKVE